MESSFETWGASWPDAGGHFGPYGGRYVPETLMEPLLELQSAWAEASSDPAYGEELGPRCGTSWGDPRRSPAPDACPSGSGWSCT